MKLLKLDNTHSIEEFWHLLEVECKIYKNVSAKHSPFHVWCFYDNQQNFGEMLINRVSNDLIRRVK